MLYNSLNDYLRNEFGSKVYKLALNAGCTCPNRDGTKGSRGCLFCSEGGSGDFAEDPAMSVTLQIESAKERVARKVGGGKYIAYFQSFSNTYGPAEKFEKIFTEAILHPDVVALSVATRPDCLPDEILGLLRRLSQIKPVWVELGLQTIHEETAALIRRGFDLACFDEASAKLHAAGIKVIVHLILGLPGETRDDILKSVSYVAAAHPDGIKFQLLHVLRNTDLASLFAEGKFEVMSMREYIDLIAECVEMLPPDTVVHRLTGDGPKSILIAPQWSADKRSVLNTIRKVFSEKDVRQGRLFRERQSPNT